MNKYTICCLFSLILSLFREVSSEDYVTASPYDNWIIIEKQTFTNWINEQLRSLGDPVEELPTDFQNGVKLCKLVGELQGRNIPVNEIPQNDDQVFENAKNALSALANDNVTLVEIGKSNVYIHYFSSRQEIYLKFSAWRRRPGLDW